MREMPDMCVDLVLSSPPYNFGGFNRDGRIRNYDTIDDNMPEGKYREFISVVLAESSRVLKLGGVMCWNHKGHYDNWKYKHPYWVVALSPLRLYQEIIWQFPSGPDVSKVKFYPRIEYIFVFSKGRPGIFNEKYAKKTNCWMINHQNGGLPVNHPAPFPMKLALNCIGAFSAPDSIILDPFLGSGTTAIAAGQLGRNFIGIEISSEYCRIAEERLKRETAQLNMFFGKGPL
jgi:modification methylase